MHLKSLTMKGFKSFASATKLDFEPGVTCVVGPNGSGKSNVVDALSWVMGEQGAKSLRGGKMEDVIFAGTAGKAPLGRAEVMLTIDNGDGALPIDYGEVTISRIMFRSGGSEYAINGAPCRLLDVQELLSDSGIGREMHVIVGQGQLDSILHATTEDRRGFIEEAAGVLKHRRRKEKTLRKLEALTDKMNRLSDLTTELRRQLKPLGRQAEVAKRAVVVQADARDAKLRILADDLRQMRATLQREQSDEAALRQLRGEVEAQLLADQAREAELVAEAQAAGPALAREQDTWFRLSGLVERFRAVASVARERTANLSSDPDPGPDSSADPERLDREAGLLTQERAELADRVRSRREALAEHTARRVRAESELAEEERRVESERIAASEHRERHARVSGQVNAARSRLDARQVELRRLLTARSHAEQRAERATAEFAELEREVVGLGRGEANLDAHHEAAVAERVAVDAELAEARGRESRVKQRRAAADGRLEALRRAVAARRPAPDAVPDREGILGLVPDLMRASPGYERALAAALGDFADGLVVDTLRTATDVAFQPGCASWSFVIAALPGGTEDPLSESDPPRLAQFVEAAEPCLTAASRLLEGVVVVDGPVAAVEAVNSGRARRVVTVSGDLVTAESFRPGGSRAASGLELAAEVEVAERAARDLEGEAHRVRFRLEALDRRAEQARAQLRASLAALHESDATLAAAGDRLGSLAAQVTAARAEAERLAEAVLACRRAVDDDERSVVEVSRQLARLERSQHRQTEPVDGREDLAAALDSARTAEMDSRLALRTDEERLRVVQSRAEQLRDAARRERGAREAAVRRRRLRARQAEVAGAVLAGASTALAEAQRLSAAAAERRESAEHLRAIRDQSLIDLRNSIKAVSAELERLTDSVHRDEVLRAEQRVRIQQIENRAMEQFGIGPEELLTEYGPDVPIPPGEVVSADEEGGFTVGESYPYVRLDQERRLRSAERALALLGKVNPLALEEFAAVEERHRFLSEQLEDLKSSRNDLLKIVKDVDDRVRQVFAEAFADTAREFEHVFARLFPGGEGRLSLSDPSDLSTSGVEVEARPPGKKIKRLSLLSGGERSLTAVAFLVALFKARPSPFYVLDEVEAALDDVNLGRLLVVIEELRRDSQLIVITHQKRTMESADSLYGVAMRGDGVSHVVSQRLREPVGA